MQKFFGIPSLFHLGYGLMSSWVVCMSFLINRAGVLEIVPGSFATVPWLISSVAVTSALALLVLLRRFVGFPSAHRGVGLVCMSLTTLGTILTAQGSIRLSVAGALMTGVGTAWLWILWGEFFSRLASEDAERIVIMASLMSTVLILVVSLLPLLAQEVCCALMPIVCFICGDRSLGHPVAIMSDSVTDDKGSVDDCPGADGDLTSGNGRQDIRRKSFFVDVALCIGGPCSLIFLLQIFYFYFQRTFTGSLSSAMLVNTAGFLLFLAVLILFFRFTPVVNARFIFKWSAPLIVLAAIMLGTDAEALIGAGLLTASVMVVDQFRWIYTAKVYRSSTESVVAVFGGMCALYQGFILIGSLLGVLLLVLFTNGIINAEAVAIGALGFMCLLLLLVFDRDRADGAAVTVASEQTPEDIRVRGIAKRYALSVREQEILIYLLKGRNALFIRDQLVISKNTVNTHIRHIYAKHNVHNRQELIDLYEKGL
jgi:DNA-binding CsgD family transcriptional regulator